MRRRRAAVRLTTRSSWPKRSEDHERSPAGVYICVRSPGGGRRLLSVYVCVCVCMCVYVCRSQSQPPPRPRGDVRGDSRGVDICVLSRGGGRREINIYIYIFIYIYIYITVAFPLRMIEHIYTPLRVSARDPRCAWATSFLLGAMLQHTCGAWRLGRIRACKKKRLFSLILNLLAAGRTNCHPRFLWFLLTCPNVSYTTFIPTIVCLVLALEAPRSLQRPK
jgi:hypothetical protein